MILNPDFEPILSLERLEEGKLIAGNWTPRSSGVEIRSDITEDLEAMWFSFSDNREYPNQSFSPNSNRPTKSVSQGGCPAAVFSQSMRENPYARKNVHCTLWTYMQHLWV